MTKTQYKAYLQTPEWQARRLEAIEYGDSVCAECEIPRWLAGIAYDQDLHVHHVSYANQGNEFPEDLMVLCRRCHELETFKRTELREVKRAHCEACGGLHWDYRSKHCIICAAMREYPRGVFRRLQQPDAAKQGQPYWMTVLEDVAIDTVLDGATPEDVGQSIGRLVEAYAKRFLRESKEDIPF